MDPLKALSLCALLGSASQAGQNCAPVSHVSSALIDRWQPEITAASQRFDIPEDWIRAVMQQESAGLTTLDGHPITSRAGAMGLMQLMPGTWSDMRTRYRLGRDPYDPRDNILAGTAYLRQMYDRYGYPNLFAAYHAGPGRMDGFLAGRKSLPEATQTYLKNIVSRVELAPLSVGNPVSKPMKSTPNSLFFVRPERENPSSEPSKSDSKSVKSASKIDESHDESAPTSAGDSADGESGLFIPLSRPAR